MNFIDLFSGAGGLSEGFIRNGFEPIAHVEMDLAACNTLKTRAAYHYLKSKGLYDVYVKYLKGEISRADLYSLIPDELLNSVINLPISKEYNDEIQKRIHKNKKRKKVDLIIGGPPCQAYSLVGRARSENGMKGDSRNYLYVQYAKYLEEYKPKMFVFENVIGLKSANKGIYLKNMKKLFDKKGYNMKLFTIKASSFGVLQNRRRIIIIGWDKQYDFEIPDLESINLANDKYSVNDVLDDLPKLQAGEGQNKYTHYRSDTNEYLNSNCIRNGVDILAQHKTRPHSEQDKEIYRIAVEKWNIEKERLDYNDLPEKLKTHKNRSSFFDRFKVVASDKPYSQTIVAHIAKDGHYYIHPDLKQNRSLSIREAARLQSFPDDYYFEGVRENVNRTPAFKQIGNAVPPLMAYEIAKVIKQTLK
ncbi:DNA (cytosine-5-)-methyltransferase [bacterium SCSIO 12643]|nr:DNA (cytosine-5-)-methyltransferase [bacterium SCSIO 12643]